MTGAALRYTVGASEVDADGVRFMVVPLGDALVWIAQDGSLYPLGGGPELPAGERPPAAARLGDPQVLTPRLPAGWTLAAPPQVKSAAQYLDPWDWHDEPIPAGQPRPWELGQVCGWLRIEGHGYRLCIAARTPQRAVVMAPAVARAWDAREGRYGG